MKLTIHVSEEKLAALGMYLTQKETDIETELSKYTEQLYLKTVPQNVRDFIEMSGAKKPARRPRTHHPSDPEETSDP